MKEVTNQDIRSIEDREMRALLKYEQIIAWHQAGGVQVALAEFHSQIAAAEQAKAVAELRVAQINVISTRVARFDVKAVRNAQMAAIAAKHRADAAERQAIQEAVAEVLALEDIVPTDDIDDILAQVSSALGIELPTDADRADICQRGHKSIADLKHELGPSLADPVKQTQAAEADVAKAEELVSDLRRSALLQGLEASPVTEKYFEIGQDRVKAERALLDFIKVLAAKAHGLTGEPSIKPTKFRFVGAWFRPDGSDCWSSIPQNGKLSTGDDVLDDATLDAAWKAANDQPDAGRSLEQLGWSPPSYDPPRPPDSIASWDEAVMRSAS